MCGDHPLAYGSYLYYQYSIDRAKQTLKDSGWNFTNGVWQKKEGYNTIRLRINLLVQASNENRVKVSEIIKKNLEECGIPVTINQTKDWNYENSIKNRNYDILISRSNSSD